MDYEALYRQNQELSEALIKAKVKILTLEEDLFEKEVWYKELAEYTLDIQTKLDYAREFLAREIEKYKNRIEREMPKLQEELIKHKSLYSRIFG